MLARKTGFLFIDKRSEKRMTERSRAFIRLNAKSKPKILVNKIWLNNLNGNVTILVERLIE